MKQLERQKNHERENQFGEMAAKEQKDKMLRDQAARQREKIKGLKQVDIENQNE